MKGKGQRILYLQYTNPAGYPSLEHSARMLADRGWEVLFLGTVAPQDRMRFRPHPNITVRYLPFQTRGWRQKLHFLKFCAWAAVTALRWQPQWLYASDMLSTPSTGGARLYSNARVIYHEHDTPALTAGAWMRLNFWARKQIAASAALCVLPNAERAAGFEKDTGARVVCVWNCPTRDEVAAPKTFSGDDPVWLYYHGSMVPVRLPLAVVEALARLPARVKLRAVGYETVGHVGYVQELLTAAQARGVRERVEIIGAVPRAEVMRLCHTADIGLAFMPLQGGDWNEQTMTGASNKPFDYLACGLPLIVSDLYAWRAMFVQEGFARACDPADAASIAEAVQWYLDHPDERRAMGERGREKILQEWNYETQFAPILHELEREESA